MSLDSDLMNLGFQAGQIFTPNTPITIRDMFSGRVEQIRKIMDVVHQTGQHAIVFGDRGVGKTSLALIILSLLSTDFECIKMNCDTGDNFSSVWKKAVEDITMTRPSVGFMGGGGTVDVPVSIDSIISTDNITPHEIRKLFATLGTSFRPIFIFDEFDRLQDDVKGMFADLIKTLSDYSVDATIILIGVGESVEQLIREHESVSRALVQISMPRMSQSEIIDIINKGVSRLGMQIEEEVLIQISLLSKGLPYYAHLLGLHSVRCSLDIGSMKISMESFTAAVNKSVEDAQHSIRTSYHKSIRSTIKNSLFSAVILACAMTPGNDLGEFAAQDIRGQLHKITGRKLEIPAFVKHLDEFSSSKRENLLIKTGARKRYRYKFRDPLMQSFVIMQGVKENKIQLK